MASAFPRRPTVVPDEISSTKIQITLLVDDLVPKGKQDIKNGTMNIQLSKVGMAFTATINKKDGSSTRWELRVRKFPSDISASQSTWKVEKGKVILELMKATPMSWTPMLRNGLDQADSSDED